MKIFSRSRRRREREIELVRFVKNARADLELWGLDTSGLSDEQAIKLFVQEWSRRWRAVGAAAKSAGGSIDQLARDLKAFHRSVLKAATTTQA